MASMLRKFQACHREYKFVYYSSFLEEFLYVVFLRHPGQVTDGNIFHMPRIEREWHRDVTEELRNHLVQKLLVLLLTFILVDKL